MLQRHTLDILKSLRGRVEVFFQCSWIMTPDGITPLGRYRMAVIFAQHILPEVVDQDLRHIYNT